jgi:hypothetical protein
MIRLLAYEAKFCLVLGCWSGRILHHTRLYAGADGCDLLYLTQIANNDECRTSSMLCHFLRDCREMTAMRDGWRANPAATDNASRLEN